MEGLFHLIYASAARWPHSRQELMALLEVARTRNSELGVTGMLLYSEGSFFQVLEGEQATLESLFAVIRNNPRHERITKIIQEPIPSRAFGDWSMAYAGTTPEELASIGGLSDFFAGGTCLADIDSGRAKKLLLAFSAGRWRQSLS